MPHPSVLKRRLRREAKEIRAKIEDREERVAAIQRRIKSWNAFQNARTILFYLANSEEISLDRLVESAWARKCRVVVPFCEGLELRLCEIFSWNETEPGSFGIREPLESVRKDLSRRMPSESLDFLLVPGLGFDRSGGRLGYGKGYYDRFLNGMKTAVPIVGVTFTELVFPVIPTAGHDFRVGAIINQHEIYDCRTGCVVS